MAIRKFQLGIMLVCGFVTIAYGLPPEKDLSVTFGDNAYRLQEETGFPMGYPTHTDGLGPIGGKRNNVNASLSLGPIEITCSKAYLALYRKFDIVNSGEIYCPVGNGPEEVMPLHNSINTAWNWDRFEDFTRNPRRAVVYGNSVQSAFKYLEDSPMRGTVLRVPLYSWREEDGIYIEVNAARNARMGGNLTYEVKISWGTSCLIGADVDSDPRQQNDAQRAEQNKEKLSEVCPEIPAIFMPPTSE